LHLVEPQEGAVASGFDTGCFPLLGDPLLAAQGRLVGAGESDRQASGQGRG
jgi:hypothetical protein